MNINLTTINGTDSIASSRLTINQNFSTVAAYISIYNTLIDASTKNITTTGTLTSGGITVSNGNIAINGGGISCTGATFSGNVNLQSGIVFGATSVNFAGVATSSIINHITLPRRTKAQILATSAPAGAMVFNTTDAVPCYCIGGTYWYKAGSTVQLS